ncbi:MAG: hypothetical protein A3E80_00100 [Chlamydiae bacterium RIFCSPHIGHO2_12_FULL_49_9]|nr:MAG: hypothetical protein A3E80_00100 [Chlamydiae bacterium RIFCSPHIGHO2_12_FULL_49_9]
MEIKISRREVLNNLIRFKDNLLDMREDGALGKGKARSYRVLLNRHTGDMRFEKKITSLEHHLSSKGRSSGSAHDWIEVRLLVEKERAKGVCFELCDAEGESILPQALDPIAWKVASETLHVLNIKGKGVKEKGEMLAEEIVLHDLSSIHISTQSENIEDFPGWAGSIDRLDAERRLFGRPEGTYILRNGDQLTLSMTFHFSEENHITVRPFILTVVEREKKISDILLLETEKGWVLYEDDPDLKDPYYHYHESLRALFKLLCERAKYPL